MHFISLGLWWVCGTFARKLPSGRWHVRGCSVVPDEVATSPLRAVVYAPKSCGSAINAMFWASNSAAWSRLRLHSQGARLLSAIKKKIPDPKRRTEELTTLNMNLVEKYGTGWLYKSQEAQDIAAKLILGIEKGK